MKKQVLFTFILAIVATMWTGTVQAQLTYYKLHICGKTVSSANCNDLSVIDGVSGKVSYDPNTNTLTLDNATIDDVKYGFYAPGVLVSNTIDDLTIRLIGNNLITAEKLGGMFHGYRNLTITGDGKLTIKGSETCEEGTRYGFHNQGSITVSGCTLVVSGGIMGLHGGRWKFDNCNVRAKGGGCPDKRKGSIGYMWYNIPEFINCAITSHTGTYWKLFDANCKPAYSLFGADDNVITDWVTITKGATGIDTPNADTATKQGIYTLSGVRLEGELNDLPKGVYIVNGQKVVKQ